MSDPQNGIEGAARIDRKDAELIVRGWNLLFNRCFSYAFDHPLVQETIPRVWELFRAAIQRSGTLNIQLMEAMFFVDGADVMYQPNNRRIADHLRRFKIESITLASNFTAQDFATLVDASALTHPDPVSFLKYYQGRGGSRLEINQISMRAVRGDEVVANAGVVRGGAGFAGSTGQGEGGGEDRFEDIVLKAMVGRLTAQELEGNVALVQLLADPQALGRAALENTQGVAPQARAAGMGQMVMNVLSHFATQQAKQGFSVEELLAGIYAMRGEMLSMVKSQKTLETGLAEEEVEAATDGAFDQTVCRIILEEFKASKGNSRRVAHVLGRVVPGKKELRRILPKLKDTLLSAGCGLPEWYGLVKELSVVVQGDKALEELAAAASEMGVSPDEILSELRKDPRGAARLLVVASEIRRAGGDPTGDAALQSLLESMDRTGQKITDDVGDSPSEVAGAVQTYNRLQAEVRQELSSKDMAPEVRGNMMRKLDLRATRTLTDLKAKVLAGQLRDPNGTIETKAGALGELIQDEAEIEGILEMAFNLVGTDELAQQIGHQIAEKVRNRLREERERAASRDLPAGVYPKAVAEFFLRYETRRASRYGVPFSAMLVSFQGLPEDKESLEAHGIELRGLFHVLAGDLRSQLREVDFVGSLGYNRILIVLPMTVEANGVLVGRKIRERLGREVALPTGERTWVRPRLGVASFGQAESDGLREIMARLSQNWQEDN
jgi:hypothetical protein